MWRASLRTSFVLEKNPSDTEHPAKDTQFWLANDVMFALQFSESTNANVHHSHQIRQILALTLQRWRRLDKKAWHGLRELKLKLLWIVEWLCCWPRNLKHRSAFLTNIVLAFYYVSTKTQIAIQYCHNSVLILMMYRSFETSFVANSRNLREH